MQFCFVYNVSGSATPLVMLPPLAIVSGNENRNQASRGRPAMGGRRSSLCMYRPLPGWTITR
jgi:hypothetical protein